MAFVLSCSKDERDELPTVFGSFTVEGVTYDLHECAFGYWGPGDNSLHYYMFLLHSSEIYFVNNDGFVGNGSSVEFFFISSAIGEFSASNSQIIPADSAFQADKATYVELYPVFDDEEAEYYYACNSGTFSLTIDNENVFTISIEGEAEKISQATGDILMRDVPVSVLYEGRVEDLSD